MVNVDTFWLKINYFLLTNRKDFKKWWVILLIALGIFVVVFTFTNAILYIIGTSKQSEIMLSMAGNAINFDSIRERNKPVTLQIVDTTILPAINEKFDLVAHITNSNTSWAVESIDYRFIINGEETDTFSDYIMPQSDKYLTVSGVDVSGDGDQVSLALDVTDIVWKRVSSEEELISIDFAIENIEYSNFSSLNGIMVNSVSANIENKSFRNFWTTKFVVVLYSNDVIAGIDYVYFDNFEFDESRLVSSQWNNLPFTVTDVVILPDMNLLDYDNLIN